MTVHAFAAQPGIIRLAAADRAALEHPTSVRLLYSVSGIPASVRSACATVISDHKFWLADPGKRYNESCAADERIPDRRLIWAARLPDCFVVHYESGGIAHSFHIIVVSFPGASPRVIWKAAADDHYKTYARFVSALEQDELSDRYVYMF